MDHDIQGNALAAEYKVKSYLRPTMVEERVSSLAPIFCNKELHLNIKNVISKFAHASSRRLEFLF